MTQLLTLLPVRCRCPSIDDMNTIPGLPSRKKPQSVGRRAGAQELPTLAKQHLMPRAACLGDSPEMPEFTSNFVKAMAMGKDKAVENI